MRYALVAAFAVVVGCGGPPARTPSEPERLRAAGPEGLSQVLAAYDAETDPAKKERLSAMADAVARQKDVRFSRLYWYTDLEAAKAAARASGRPILSLRLLGELDEELSCANSRFFRTTLYPNREVQALLRDRFVLHWSSERPAPVMTIDFRDGRVVRRTVTGNSLHYVLDSDGDVIDAIPGLWGPHAFAEVVRAAGEEARRVASLAPSVRSFDIQQWHAARLADLRREWPRDVALAGLPVQAFPADRAIAALPGGGFRNAALAMPVAMSKALVERPAVQAVVPPPPELGALEGNVPWATLGKVHADASKLDEAAIAAVAAKHPRAWADASDLGRPLTGAEVSALVTSFEGTMAADTARNAYFHHALIHEWLATAPASFESLNARIYAEIFRTPANDPWLGLVPPGAYSAIQDDGIVKR